MGFLKGILLESYTLLGRTNKVIKPSAILSASRWYATDDKKAEFKKEKKLKKLPADVFPNRTNKWVELNKKYNLEVVAKGQEIIKVKLLDGKIVEGFSWEITPMDVAKSIGSSLAAEVYLAKVNDALWDLERPLESDCTIQLFKFNTSESKAAFWTTSAYILADALERMYCTDNGGVVCNVGSTGTGFFVDIQLKSRTINKKDFAAIEEEIWKILSVQRTKVDRIVVSKVDAIEMFANNPFKLKAIKESVDERIAIYRCGSFMDTSINPLIRHNKKVNAVKLLKIESVLLYGESIQRIHGVAFPTAKELKDFLKDNKLT